MENEDTTAPRNTARLLIVVIAIAAIGLTVTGLTLTGVVSLNLSCFGVSGTQRNFTIIANTNGYNDSKTLVGLGVWPIMNVSRCDSVTMKVVNTDVQSHGLAVAILANSGLTVPAGQTLFLSFVASKIGHYRVYCTIICTVHDYMLNGVLNVA